MRLIDDKGRLFGKFNLLDIMVILLIILCGVAVYVGIRYPERISRIVKGEPKTKSVLVRVVLMRDSEWLYDYISIGDFQRARFAENEAEVKDKRWVLFTNEDRRLVIDLKVKVTVHPDGILTSNGREVKKGEDFIFSSKKVKFKGYVLEAKDL